MRYNFNKHSIHTIDSLGTPYDFGSMMHYGSTVFGNGYQTIKTIDPDKQRLIGQRVGFSKIDIEQIKRMYCCEFVLYFLKTFATSFNYLIQTFAIKACSQL